MQLLKRLNSPAPSAVPPSTNGNGVSSLRRWCGTLVRAGGLLGLVLIGTTNAAAQAQSTTELTRFLDAQFTARTTSTCTTGRLPEDECRCLWRSFARRVTAEVVLQRVAAERSAGRSLSTTQAMEALIAESLPAAIADCRPGAGPSALPVSQAAARAQLRGEAAMRQGDFREAAQLLEQAVAEHISSVGERHPASWSAMSSLARLYGELGRAVDHVLLNEKVVRLRTEALGEGDPETLTAMNNLAISYGSIGRIRDQVSLLERILRVRSAKMGERDADTIGSMVNLAASYRDSGRMAEALPLLEKAVLLRTQLLGERDPDTLLAMSNLAAAYGRVKRTADELAINQRVLRLRIEVLGERNRATLVSMNNLAVSLGSAGRWSDAIALGDKTLRLSAELLGDSHRSTLSSMGNLASAYLRGGRPREAAALSQRFVVGAEAIRAQPGIAAEYRQALFSDSAEAYRVFAAAHASTGQMEEAWRLVELGKARTLLEGMVSRRAERSGALPAADQDRLEALRRRVGALEQQIARAEKPESRQALEETRKQVVIQLEDLQGQLRSRHPKFAQLSDIKLMDARELRKLLPTNAVAVSYFLVGDEVAALVANAAGSLHRVELGLVPRIGDAVEMLRRGQAESRPLQKVLADEQRRAWRAPNGSFWLLPTSEPPPGGSVEAVDTLEVSKYLSDRLLKPLATHLKDKSLWIISPDGPLAQVAFEALPFGAEGKRVVSRGEIVYTQSLSTYALGRALQQQYERLPSRQSLFAVGNPLYSERPLNPQERRSARREASVRTAQQLPALDGVWEALPGTEREVKAVAALFPGSAAVHSGEQATEQHLQSLNARGQLKNYRYILMSVHGFLSADKPALSAIVLGLRTRTEEADGYVTASEWPGYDLRSDLMVLSACDTGVGQIVTGEGVLGLPYALLVAGNVNTILTLWPIDDFATTEFVTSLFTRLKAGRSAAQALAETKREFIHHKKYSHPRFWAPFILVGSG